MKLLDKMYKYEIDPASTGLDLKLCLTFWDR